MPEHVTHHFLGAKKDHEVFFFKFLLTPLFNYITFIKAWV